MRVKANDPMSTVPRRARLDEVAVGARVFVVDAA
jgi:hypothetical protein